METLQRTRVADPAQAGLTLIELMVVLVMLGLLVAVALPSFRRDQAQNDFETLVDRLAQDLQAARYQAISDKTLRDVHIFPTSTTYYQLVVPAVGTVTTEALLRQQAIPFQTEITGYSPGTVESHVASGATSANSDVRVRFSMIGDLQVCTSITACTFNSITIYLHTADDRYQARLIVSKSNGLTRRLEGW